jgi:hypothetical protein
VAEGTSYQFADLKNMTFTPSSVGEETLYYTLLSYPNQMNGTIVISVTSTSSLVTVNLDNSKPYTFSTVTVEGQRQRGLKNLSRPSTAPAARLIRTSFSARKIPPPVRSLYKKRRQSDRHLRQDILHRQRQPTTDNLYFIPAGTGTYSRSFTAYDAGRQQAGRLRAVYLRAG